ncbi:unnamed protein product [Caenorhabditis nigoni]
MTFHLSVFTRRIVINFGALCRLSSARVISLQSAPPINLRRASPTLPLSLRIQLFVCIIVVEKSKYRWADRCGNLVTRVRKICHIKSDVGI